MIYAIITCSDLNHCSLINTCTRATKLLHLNFKSVTVLSIGYLFAYNVALNAFLLAFDEVGAERHD